MSHQITHRLSRMGWRVMLTIALLLGLFAAPPPVSACGCTIPDPQTAFQRADAVFVGTVISTSNYVPFLSPKIHKKLAALGVSRAFDQRVVMEVSESWRGVTTTQVVVYNGTGSCISPVFNVGVQFLVYALESQGDLVAHGCIRTGLLVNAAEDLQYLQTVPQLTLRPTVPWGLIAGISLPLFVLGVLLWGKHKRRQRTN